MRNKINTFIDKVTSQIERFSIWRWHILFMFFGLGFYLVILPVLHFITVSLNIETELGNYTNVISAGVSLLTLAEAKRITDKQNQIHKHLGLDKKTPKNNANVKGQNK